MRCLLLAKHRKGERNAKVDTEGEVLVAMAEKPWYKPVFGTLVVLGLVLIATGAMFTEQGADEIAYGTSGQFVIDASNVDASIIVVTDEVDGNCENFAFSVDLQDGNYDFIPVEKTDCERWSSSESYQYRLNNLTQGRYGFSASDDVSIVAVTGDVDEYLENYALGNGLADIGSCFCCLSFIVPLILGRMSSQTMDSAHHFELNDSFVMPTPYEGPSESPATALDAEDHGAEPATEVEDEESTAEEQDAGSANEDEKEQPEGAFWGGLNND